MLRWSAMLGGIGSALTLLIGHLLRADLRSLGTGIALALGIAMVGMLAVIPVARAGQMAFPLVLVLYGAQVFALYALAGPLRAEHWVHARPLAFAALAAVLSWQSGATVGYVRSRTPLLDLRQEPGR